MTVRNTYKRELRLIEFGLFRSDPRLSAQLNVFCRLTADQGMPAWEQVPSGRDRIRDAATLTAMARDIAVMVVGVMVSTYTKTRRWDVRSTFGSKVNDD